MKEQKNIDKLFQEQLQNFEAAPSPAVWENIEAQLKKKKKERRIIPIWWKAGGVAAVLLLLITVGLPLLNDTKPSDVSNEIVQEDIDNSSTENNTPVTEVITDNSNSSITTSKQSNSTEDNNTSTKNTTSKQNPVFSDPKQTEQDVASVPQNKKKDNAEKSIKFNKNITNNIPSEENTKIAQNNIPSTDNSGETNNSIDSSNISKTESISAKTDVASTKTKDEKTKVETNDGSQIIAPNSELTKETEVAEEKTQKDLEEASKKSIFDAIEEAKKEEEAIALQKTKNNGAWEVTPNVGPVYYSSLGQGSSIDPAFADNNQTGDVNISYGVQVAYNINDRVSVRSGVNNVNVGYSTGGIEVISGPQALGLRSVNYNTGGRNVLTAVDMGQGMILADNSNPLNQVNLKSTSTSAELIQNISYFEVPLELKYKLVNKRFGVNMIGGFSTLFLGDNEIVVTDGSFRNQLGEANNLNNLSFTTNVGIGLDYLISKKLRFNLEPMFKYQLNPYTDTSVDFRPYYLGVYSGLTFKF